MVINKLLNKNILDYINGELIDYYFSPGNIYNLYNFANSNDIDLKKTDLENFLKFIIKNNFFKKEFSLNYIFFNYIELYLKKISIDFKNNYYNYFIKKITQIKKFNLDEESFFLEFQDKIFNE